jgi:hypothetical protein
MVLYATGGMYKHFSCEIIEVITDYFTWNTYKLTNGFFKMKEHILIRNQHKTVYLYTIVIKASYTYLHYSPSKLTLEAPPLSLNIYTYTCVMLLCIHIVHEHTHTHTHSLAALSMIKNLLMHILDMTS